MRVGIGAARPAAFSAPWMVFATSMAMVMGPTPPGTGVMREATADTGS